MTRAAPRRERIRLGDIVRLNSGGPDMLVVDLHDHETFGRQVCCAYRSEDEAQTFEQFFGEAMVKLKSRPVA